MIIQLSEQAVRSLLKIKSKKTKEVVKNSISELSEKGFDASNIKKLTGLKNGYRKRVGRYRILFSFHSRIKTVKIWIIELKKDSKKDYRKWIEYIISHLK